MPSTARPVRLLAVSVRTEYQQEEWVPSPGLGMAWQCRVKWGYIFAMPDRIRDRLHSNSPRRDSYTL